MRTGLYSVVIGACGNIAFAIINNFIIGLSGYWLWAAQLGIFISLFFIAILLNPGQVRRSVGSRNAAEGKQDIKIDDAIGTGNDADIGSHNKSKEQIIKIKIGQ